MGGAGKKGVVKKWKERRVEKMKMKDREVDSKEMERKVGRRGTMEKMRERG